MCITNKKNILFSILLLYLQLNMYKYIELIYTSTRCFDIHQLDLTQQPRVFYQSEEKT